MIFIIPDDPDVITGFSGKDVIVRTADPARISGIADFAGKNKVNLKRILYESGSNLSDIDFREEWENIPLAVSVERMGKFEDIYGYLDLFKRSDLYVIININDNDAFRDARILASIGIFCGINFTEFIPDWQLARELALYALYPRPARAPINPFSEIKGALHDHKDNFYKVGIFENPEKYAHYLDGEISLSGVELIPAGNPAYENTEEANPGLSEWKLGRRMLLTGFNQCSICPGWLACGGAFYGNTGEKENGCSTVFGEIVEAVRFEKKKSGNSGKDKWQI